MSVNRIVRVLARGNVARRWGARTRPASSSSRQTSTAFRNLWLAATISDFGVYVSALALPLTAAITLHASPFQMGLLTAAESVPYVLFGLLAGVVVDRRPRRSLLIATD